MLRLGFMLTTVAIVSCYAATDHPCVDGLEHGGHYRLTLGDKLDRVPLHSDGLSCGGIKDFDRLATGSTLDVTLPMGQWGGNQYCEVPLADITTDLGLMFTPIGNYGAAATGGQPSEGMFFVNEMGLSDGCSIQWSVGTVSKNAVAALPAGLPGQDLFMVRSVAWFDNGTGKCPPLNADGSFQCFDAWKISFERVAP